MGVIPLHGPSEQDGEQEPTHGALRSGAEEAAAETGWIEVDLNLIAATRACFGVSEGGRYGWEAA